MFTVAFHTAIVSRYSVCNGRSHNAEPRVNVYGVNVHWAECSIGLITISSRTENGHRFVFHGTNNSNNWTYEDSSCMIY